MTKVKYIIEKANALNIFKSEDMGLTEFRFFCLYVSKINARDINTRTVEISMSEFEDFFDVKVNTTLFTQKIKKMMSRTIEIIENDKIKVLTLYSEFCWSAVNPHSITISCNDKMLPYLFELQKNYTTYMIENIAKLTSIQKIKLYEVMKQYEKMKVVTIPLDSLQEAMSCNTMPLFKDFKKNTLVPAVNDINKYTDVFVSYEKVLKMRKVVAIKFTIAPQKRKEDKSVINISAPEPLQIADTQPIQPNNTNEIQRDTNVIQCHTFDDSKLNNSYDNFSFDEIENIYQTIHNHFETEKECTVLMNDAVLSLDAQKVKKTIKNQFNYLLKIVSTKIIEKENNMQKYSEKNDELPMSDAKRKRDGNKLQTYTLDGVDDLVIRTEDLIQSETENQTE